MEVIMTMLKKLKNGFKLELGKVSYVFDSEVLPTCENSLYILDITGKVAVPKIEPDDRLILPVDEGIAITAGQEYESGEYDNNSIGGAFDSRGGTVGMIVVERDKKYLMICIENTINSTYCAKRNNGIYDLEIFCGKKSRVIYKIFDSLVAACKCYRNMQHKEYLTVSEKALRNKSLESLIGGGIFWVWNDHYDEVMYSDNDTELAPDVGEKLLEIAEDLHNNGVGKAMFGIFFNKDSRFVETLYEKFGYICTQYDNYNDVMSMEMLNIIPNNRVKNCDYTYRRIKDFPDGIQKNKDGCLCGAWALKGFDGQMHSQYTLCPAVAAKRINREIPQVLQKYPYYKGRFIDVYGGGLSECYDSKHPLSREECLKVKQEAFNAVKNMGLLAGTEDGFGDLINELDYTEGLHSPVNFRIHNAGRTHAHIYNEAQTKHIEKHMLNPECRVPLWHLIYHECMLAFPYWGDSTEMSVGHIDDKILFACLYGCPPLYSFSVGDYKYIRDDIIRSYKEISSVHSMVAGLPMTDFKILSDDYKIQKSVFGRKYEVIANFSDNDTVYKGKMISPKCFLFCETDK